METNRQKLEAIGLLSSYLSGDRFLYELKAPLSPYAFVNDGVLGQYLQAALTQTKFAKVLALFQVSMVRTEAHVAISKAFNDVFEQLPDRPELFDPKLMNGSKATSIKVAGVDFDLRLFRESIPDPFFDVAQFTESVRSKILNLAYVYGLDESDLKDVYIKAIDASLRPDPVKLSIYARDAYQQKNRADKPVSDAEETRLPSSRRIPPSISKPFRFELCSKIWAKAAWRPLICAPSNS
ncbi:MAG: hypothetical protein MZU97_17625 [Bacillus subtilis]|nr:hypothetical protein [Bacillus subtilis]